MEVMAELPANSKAFAELQKALEHIATADCTTPDYSRDPSINDDINSRF